MSLLLLLGTTVTKECLFVLSGVNPQNMPFTLEELVTISLRLKEVSLGLVELAFPESRPSVREDYRTAVSTLHDHPLFSPTARDTQMWAHLFKVNHYKNF